MSLGEDACPRHPGRTQRNRYEYCFYVKHHGGDPKAAQWAGDVTRPEEFGIFDEADLHELSDDHGRLYGVRVDEGNRRILFLGTRKEQVAEFPAPQPDQPWHGYPLYPLIRSGSPNRRGEKLRPSKTVFEKMERAGLLTKTQRRRLEKGDHA